MSKKVFKNFIVFSLAAVLLFSQASTALAIDSNYYPDSLYVRAGSEAILKGTNTTDGSFYVKPMSSATFAILFDTAKAPSTSFSLSIRIVSRKGEVKHLFKNYYNVTDFAQITVPSLYDGAWYTVTIDEYKDLYIKSYSNFN